MRTLLRNKVKTKTTKTALGVVLSFVGCAAVQAAEQPVPITPPGGTDLSQAILPSTGLYGALVAIPYLNNNSFYDYNGNKVPQNYNVVVRHSLAAGVLAYVYPTEIFGGKLSSDIVVPVGSPSYAIGGVEGPTSIGLEDIYADLFYWTKNVGLVGATPGRLPLSYGLNIGVGLALKMPTGQFLTDRAVNLGTNTWTWIPNFAVTYVTGPNWSIGDSTEFSARFFLGSSTENPTTHYQNGNVFDIDWSATQRFGVFRVGVTGSYQEQYSNDTLANGGMPANGGKYSFAQIGPIMEYVFPEKQVVIKAKYLLPVYERSFTASQAAVLSVGMKF